MTHVSLYPQHTHWPSNLLRFHLVFNRAMDVFDAMGHVTLLDADGSVIEHAFLDLPDGLWDAQQRILTVLFHPGWIKSGLQASAAWGPILIEGHSYRLVLEGTLRDAQGLPISTTLNWDIQAGPPLLGNIQPESWTLEAPLPGTRTSTRLVTDRPIDFLSLTSFVRLETRQHSVAVNYTPVDATTWWVTPLKPWPATAVRIVTTAQLEDLAGNQIASCFESVASSEGLLLAATSESVR